MNTISEQAPPTIELWYGNHQKFGHFGKAQRWVNILGRVIGTLDQLSISYSLNDGLFHPLSIGPDQRRLAGKGDFNVEIDCDELKDGVNAVVIEASQNNGGKTTKRVTLEYKESGVVDLPRRIEWSKHKNIQDVAQIIDGKWRINGDTISPVEVGYDRLIGVGDVSWNDFEVVLPISVHGINPKSYSTVSTHTGVGVVARWAGHHKNRADATASGQPRFGPTPWGMICWWCTWYPYGGLLNMFDPDFTRACEKPMFMKLHTPYMFRIHVETQERSRSWYRMKVWEKYEEEPKQWTLESKSAINSLSQGSILLIAHETAATFGIVEISPLS
jgi:hypothetical protein